MQIESCIANSTKLYYCDGCLFIVRYLLIRWLFVHLAERGLFFCDRSQPNSLFEKIQKTTCKQFWFGRLHAAGKCYANQRAECAAQRTQRHSWSVERPRERNGLPSAQPEDVDRWNTTIDRVHDKERADGARGGGTASSHRSADVRTAETAQPAMCDRARDRGNDGHQRQDARRHLPQTSVSQRRRTVARHWRRTWLLPTSRLGQITVTCITSVTNRPAALKAKAHSPENVAEIRFWYTFLSRLVHYRRILSGTGGEISYFLK